VRCVGHRHGRDAPVALDEPFRAVALELDVHELAGEGGLRYSENY
jgi:hypothetical protein